MITLYKAEDLGRVRAGWLDSKHHFSFGDYYNSARMGFGALRVINDDLIKAGSGFDFHPHKDMEIITFVREGSVIHRDSLGNEGRTEAGDVQVMSAGTGIVHAEFADPETDTRLFQIWIRPRVRNLPPRWEQAQFPKTPVANDLILLASGRKGDAASGALIIHQDAAIYGGYLPCGKTLVHQVQGQAYIVISSGSSIINGMTMKEGDGAEVTGEQALTIEALEDMALLVIEEDTQP